jgi:hypothetical protein
MVALALLGAGAALASSSSLAAGGGSAASASAGPASGAAPQRAALKQRHRKARCRWVRRAHHKKHRVCRKRRKPPSGEGAGPTGPGQEPPPGPTEPGGGGSGEPEGEPEGPGGRYFGRLPDVPTGSELVDLIDDYGFESSMGGFEPNSSPAADGSLDQSDVAAIHGKSLHVTAREYGRLGVYHSYRFGAGPLADSVTVKAQLRVDSASAPGRRVKVCAIAYIQDENEPRSECQSYPVDADNVVEVFQTLDTAGAKLARVFFQVTLEDSGTISFTLDEAHLFVVQKIGSGGGSDDGSGGDGSGSGGGNCDLTGEPVPDGPPVPGSVCDANETPAAGGVYTPMQPLNLAAQRPFISLADYSHAAPGSPIFVKFKNWVNEAVDDHSPGYGYSSTDAVIMFSRSGEAKYIDDAIARVDAQVRSAEAEIAAGEAPAISNDSYLDVGEEMEELALAYDYGIASNKLDQEHQARWKAYGDQVLSNLWSPNTATWGSGAPGHFAWSGWSINNPGNNYNFSFIEATQMWALATQNQAWIHFLQTYKFPLIANYYAGIIGGGSREGTGYGTAQKRLWENARMWRSSTGEDLTTVRTHGRESVDYWINATVPTRDYFAPIGDLSRQALPEMFDYQENLVREAMMAAPGTEQARHGLWWLRHNSVPDLLTQGFTLRTALLQPQPADTELEPSALTYSAPGVGQFFTRSSWSQDATWLQLTAGPYDESHAHEDQGGFTLYRGTWLAVTSNIWSNSGLQGGGGGSSGNDLGTAVNNVVRFDRLPAGSPAGTEPETIGQNNSTSSMSYEPGPGNLVTVHADLSNAYSRNATEVKSWKRELKFQGNGLHVHDVCEVAPDITPVFQLNVPVQPVNHGGGSISAGALQIHTDAGAKVKLVDMTTQAQIPPTAEEEEEGIHEPRLEFDSGWRIDISHSGGCEFDVDLSTAP